MVARDHKVRTEHSFPFFAFLFRKSGMNGAVSDGNRGGNGRGYRKEVRGEEGLHTLGL